MTTDNIPTRSPLLQRLKDSVKPYAPGWLLDFRLNQRIRRHDAYYRGMQPEEVFSHVYEIGVWGKSSDGVDQFSGTGSHDPSIIDDYVHAITAYLRALPRTPDVVDLGCGDFHVGSLIRPACGRYTACDVVPALIEANRKRYAGLDVEFRCIDASRDDLPPGDVVFLRQVLQHLDNGRIARILDRISRYRSLVLTEHLPPGQFTANVEKALGDTTRLAFCKPSGVVVTEPPFNLRPVSSQVLCEVREGAGIIRTIAYELG